MAVDCPGHSEGRLSSSQIQECSIRGKAPDEVARILSESFGNNIGIKIDQIVSKAEKRVVEIGEECVARTSTIIEKEIQGMIGVLEPFNSLTSIRRATFENFDETITRDNFQEAGKRNIGRKVLGLLHVLSRLTNEEREHLVEKYKVVLQNLNIECWKKLGFGFDRYIESIETGFHQTGGHPAIGLDVKVTTHIEIDLQTLSAKKILDRVFTDKQVSSVVNDGAKKLPARKSGGMKPFFRR